MRLTPEDKEYIVGQLLQNGAKLDTVDLASEVAKVQSFADEKEDEIVEQPRDLTPEEDLLDEDYFMSLRGLTPKQAMDKLQKDSPYTPEQVDILVRKINESRILPYKAKVSKKGRGEEVSEWHFVKPVDKYELGSNKYGPIYYKWYKDGTYDLLDKETFNKEKYFNLLPSDKKRQFYKHIDEDGMSPKNLATMKGNIYNYLKTNFPKQPTSR